MIEKRRKSIENDDASGTVMIDLPKAFNCICHTLLIAKLAAFGFDYDYLKCVHSYMTDRKQRTKINNVHNS